MANRKVIKNKDKNKALNNPKQKTETDWMWEDFERCSNTQGYEEMETPVSHIALAG